MDLINSMNKPYKGIYVIVDPTEERAVLMEKLNMILTHDILAVQIWDNKLDQCIFLSDIQALCKARDTPFIINNNWKLAVEMDADGVHFDKIPLEWEEVSMLLPNKIFGITCTNNLDHVRWAEKVKLGYISFCSMFDSKNNSQCELVAFETIREARTLTPIPFILAGGITLATIELLENLDYQGLAMISELTLDHTLTKKMNTIYKKINYG